MTPQDPYTLTDRPKSREGCHIRDLANERIVYEPKTHELAVLNTTAAFIFEMCDGTRTVAEILDAMTTRYEAPRALLERDLFAALADLRRRELIE